MSTAIVSIRDTAPVADAARELASGGMHHLPVVDAHGNLVGVLSSTDLARVGPRQRRTLRVGAVMSREPRTLTPDAPLQQAARLMAEHAIRSLPVVGTDGHLVGILTSTDLMTGRSGPAAS